MAGVLSERAAGVERKRRIVLQDRMRRLASTFSRTGRSIGQVVMFILFGISSALTSALAAIYSIAVRDPVTRANGVRRMIRWALRKYIGSLRVLRLIDLEVSGLERAATPGALIVANHPSLIDAPILLAYLDAVVVAKQALRANPFLSGSIRGADYVVNNDAVALIDACRARLGAGQSLLLFPECTRTAADGAIRFRRGAAQIAVRSGCPVVPVTIVFSEPLLTKQSRWWLAPLKRPRVRVAAHPPIASAPFVRGSRSVSIAARQLTAHLQDFYSEELTRREPA
jgi:1-acyl-sn-glycerol-3-phosphate acyltransferase